MSDPERVRRQERTFRLLADLMREQEADHLMPVMVWQVAGDGEVIAEPEAGADDKDRRSAVTAWTNRLGLEVKLTARNDGMVNLLSHGVYDGVTVAVRATLWGEGV